MKHAAPAAFDDPQVFSVPTLPTPSWRQRLARWWQRAGWDRTIVPETLRADVEGDHPAARPVRGRAEWERRL